MASISSVKDPTTGSNYGGIKSDALGVNTAYNEYLKNSLESTRRPVVGAMRQEQYTPSANRSATVGQISNQTLGSLPIFGAGGAVFPQAVLDNYAKAKQEAEVRYINELGDTSLEQFQLASTLKNPWHNQAFSNKYQESLDAWLNASAASFGGDAMMGAKALKGNKDYWSMMKSYEDYANIYNSVFDDAVGILLADPKETYVSDLTQKAAQKFVHDYENLEDLSIDELVRRARTFKTHVSVNKVADMAMSDIGERVNETYSESKAMGTDEMNAYIKKTEKGPSDAELKELYDLQLEAFPWIKDDKKAKQLLWAEMQKRADKSTELALSTIKKGNAAENSYMKKNGIKVDKSGRVQTIPEVDTMFSQFERGLLGKGKDAIRYPVRDMNNQPVKVNPVPGTIARVLVPNADGRMEMFTISLPGTFAMTPQQEYSASGLVSGTGRYVEGIIKFEDRGLYSREFTTTSRSQGVISDPVATGGRTATTAEILPIVVKDLKTGNKVSLHGEYQVSIPFGSVRDELNTSYPFLERTHADLEQKTSEAGAVGTEQTTAGKEVQIDKPGAKSSAKPVKINTKKDDPGMVTGYAVGQEFDVDGVIMVWDGTNLNRK